MANSIIAIWGAVTGTIGVVLGVINAVQAYNDKIPRLKFTLMPDRDNSMYVWKMANPSSINITIIEAFYVRDTGKNTMPTIIKMDDESLPFTLEPKKDKTILISVELFRASILKELATVRINEHGVKMPPPKWIRARLFVIDAMGNYYCLEQMTDRNLDAMSITVKGKKNDRLVHKIRYEADSLRTWSEIAAGDSSKPVTPS